jgi:surface polysaccharide O-acyltransferase-like enzyme
MRLNSPFVLVTSIELLVGFLKLKPHYSRVVNKLASATLGVYLIHDNNLFRPYLWGIILKNSEMYSSRFLIVHAVISIAAVYFVCSLIDLLRQTTVEKIFLNIVNSV